MVAKIGHGENIMGALAYNQLKVQKDNGAVIFMHKMVETPDGNYSVNQLSRSFEPYLLANRRTDKPVLHISLNPAPKDKVSDEDFKSMAEQYMQQMGYGDQPFVVFKHTDISRIHIHIVSVCVDEEGKKIPDAFERRRSMDICRALEQDYNLMPATVQSRRQDDRIFQPVNYVAGDIKSKVASVVRYLPAYYRFQGFGGYNALLSLFNITAEEVKGELGGKPKEGLVYFALNEQGEKVSNPFKASLFGKNAGYAQLQMQFRQSKESMKNDPARPLLKSTIEVAIHTASNEVAFRHQLSEQSIDTIVRRNPEGRVYGITFIDHTSRTVWNGSHLGKELAAGVFNDWWNNNHKPEANGKMETGSTDGEKPNYRPAATDGFQPSEKPHELFDFLTKNKPSYPNDDPGFIEGLGGLLPQEQGDDYEEQAFENQIKKKKKQKNGVKNP